MSPPLDTVILISLDCLRRESISCYPYRFDNAPSPDTPTLDCLARRGVRFDEAITQAPFTPASHGSVFTGENPYTHGIRAMVGNRLSPNTTPLAEHLKGAGFATASFIGAHALSTQYGLDRGFDVYDEDFEEGTSNWILGSRRSCEESTNRALQWLSKQTGKAFLFVHYFDAHDIAGRPETALPPFQMEQMTRIDAQIHRLTRLVEAMGRSSSTLWVLFSDHGDAFGEHDEHCHREYLYDTTLRMPLILSGGSFQDGSAVEAQVRAIDIFPTILQECGLPEVPRIEGLSLVPMLKAPVSRPAYSETCHEVSPQDWNHYKHSFASLRQDGWKLILDRLSGDYQLFHLPSDPRELVDFAPIQRDLAATMAREVHDMSSREPLDSEGQTDMSEGSADLMVDRMKELGYLR